MFSFYSFEFLECFVENRFRMALKTPQAKALAILIKA